MSARTESEEEKANRLLYLAFASAWSAGDIEALASMVTDDVFYGASVGPEPGASYRGRREAIEGFRTIMQYDRGKAMSPVVAEFIGDTAFVEWLTMGPSGQVRGFDVIKFRDGRIASKDAYRKCLPLSGASPFSNPDTGCQV